MSLWQRVRSALDRKHRPEPQYKSTAAPQRPAPPPQRPDVDTTPQPDEADLGLYARKSPPADPRSIDNQFRQLELKLSDQAGARFGDDGVSGHVHWSKRPGLSALVYAVERGELGGVAFDALDRLTRDVQEQEEILARVWSRGGRVVSLREGELYPDSPGDFTRQRARLQVGQFAEMERLVLRERQQRGRERHLAAGRYNGGRPLRRKYGYELVDYYNPAQRKLKGEWQRIPEEMAIVWEIHDRCPRELGYEAMARELNARGVPTVDGGLWLRCTVYVIAKRPEQAPRNDRSVAQLPAAAKGVAARRRAV